MPIIVGLISLSLVGLVALQVSWFYNLLELKKNQFHEKLNNACAAVAIGLYSAKTSEPLFNLRHKRIFGAIGGENGFLIRPATVDEKFRPTEVRAKIARSLSGRGLKDLSFEYAVIDEDNEVEMKSVFFDKQYFDTVNNIRIFVPVCPATPAETDAGSFKEHLIVVVPHFDEQVWASLYLPLLIGSLFLVIILSAFGLTLSTLFRQKKISEIKSDFINNMTHEFKTPIATISLAVDSLRNQKVMASEEKMNYFTAIIKEENKRMNKHVETILQAALNDKKELGLNVKDVHVHEIVGQALDKYALQLAERDGKAEIAFASGDDLIEGDPMHLLNLFSNLVDNAIKYSDKTVLIEIRSKLTPQSIAISIKDHGIGMSKENQKNIYQKFFRAHTGNVHNVKGFGLGMSYVKMVVDAHKGKIELESTVGRGSTFTVQLPRKQG